VLLGAFRDDSQARAEEARVVTMGNATDLTALPIEQAAQRWKEQHSMYVSESTIECYDDYLTRLYRFPWPDRLDKIHIGHFQEYQRAFKGTYGSASINHDLNTLSQILKMAGLWLPIAEHYRPLQVPRRGKPRVLTIKQEGAFFELAASDQSWWGAYWEASLSNNTTAYGAELRKMQRSDIDLESDPPTIVIPEGKNQYRPRVIPLNEHGLKMVERMLARAAERGSTRPEHYVFPFRVKRNLFDPTRPASPSWTNAQWNKLVAKALELKIIPFRISRRNFRNQPITKMLEAGVPIETVRSVAGHVSDEMTRYYDQHRTTVKAAALSLIDPDRKKPVGFSTRKRRRGVIA
jgi:integrase